MSEKAWERFATSYVALFLVFALVRLARDEPPIDCYFTALLALLLRSGIVKLLRLSVATRGCIPLNYYLMPKVNSNSVLYQGKEERVSSPPSRLHRVFEVLSPNPTALSSCFVA